MIDGHLSQMDSTEYLAATLRPRQYLFGRSSSPDGLDVYISQQAAKRGVIAVLAKLPSVA
jgi:hypothetical protein